MQKLLPTNRFLEIWKSCWSKRQKRLKSTQERVAKTEIDPHEHTSTCKYATTLNIVAHPSGLC